MRAFVISIFLSLRVELFSAEKVVNVTIEFGGYSFNSVEPWNLPLLPSRLPPIDALARSAGSASIADTSAKRIPRNIWVSFKKAPRSDDELVGPWAHLRQMKTRNPSWAMHLMGAEEQHKFMEEHFRGTSLLWAFKAVNPAVGVPHSDIWRYAAMWLYGGLYIDDDSDIGIPFDNILRNNNYSMILSTEGPKPLQDYCYRDGYHLSLKSMEERYKTVAQQPIYDSKVLLQWAFFAEPHHPVLHRILQNIVELLRLEYMRESALQNSPLHGSFLQIMCTTGPHLFSLSIRELMYEAVHRYGNISTAQFISTSSYISSSIPKGERGEGREQRADQLKQQRQHAKDRHNRRNYTNDDNSTGATTMSRASRRLLSHSRWNDMPVTVPLLQRHQFPTVFDAPCFGDIQGRRKIPNNGKKFEYYMNRMGAYRLTLLESYNESLSIAALESRYVVALRLSDRLPFRLPEMSPNMTAQQVLAMQQAINKGMWHPSGDVFRVVNGQKHIFPSVCAFILSEHMFAKHALAPVMMKEYLLDAVPWGEPMECTWYNDDSGIAQSDSSNSMLSSPSTHVSAPLHAAGVEVLKNTAKNITRSIRTDVPFINTSLTLAAVAATSHSVASKNRTSPRSFRRYSQSGNNTSSGYEGEITQRRREKRDRGDRGQAASPSSPSNTVASSRRRLQHSVNKKHQKKPPAAQPPPSRDVMNSLGWFITSSNRDFSLILKDCACRRWEVKEDDSSVKNAAEGWKPADLAAHAILVDHVFYDMVPSVGKVSKNALHGLFQVKSKKAQP